MRKLQGTQVPDGLFPVPGAVLQDIGVAFPVIGVIIRGTGEAFSQLPVS
jgi:hypothetical protein